METVQAQTTKLSGLVFGDYYGVAAHHNETLEGRHGFWVRRIYLTLDRQLDSTWAVRVRGEMRQPGDFRSEAKMVPAVKDAYLQWTRAGHVVHLGLTAPPTFARLEDVWGYRPVKKTPLDLYGFASSRDLGLSVQGRLGNTLPVHYHAMLGNGSGTGTEVNAGKKAMLALAVSPLDAVTVEVYGDAEGTDRGRTYTLQGALYYQRNSGRLGVQYAHQGQHFETRPQADYDIISAFGAVRLTGAVHAFARFDHQFQPNPTGNTIEYLPMATLADASYVVGGLDVALSDHVHLMPNVEAVFYNKGGGEPPPATSVIPRLTFHFTY